MKRKDTTQLGGILIIIGILMILSRLNIFSLGDLLSGYWALIFLALPGVIFHLNFFKGGRKNPGLLVPGGILVFTGITCQLSYIFNAWDILWPGFILAVAIGLLELYIFGGRDSGLLISVTILGALSIIFFTSFSLNSLLSNNVRKLVFPVALIFVGFAIIFGNKNHSQNDNQSEG